MEKTTLLYTHGKQHSHSAQSYYIRCSPLRKKVCSFADSDTDVSLMQSLPFSFISKASCSSLDIRSAYLAKNLVSLNDGVHEQRLQCVARCPDGVARVAAACSRARSLKHLPVWPMYDDPHDMGISYMTPVAHSVYLLRCFVMQGSADSRGLLILRHSLDSLFGAENTIGTSYLSATFLRLWVSECT